VLAFLFSSQGIICSLLLGISTKWRFNSEFHTTDKIGEVFFEADVAFNYIFDIKEISEIKFAANLGCPIAPMDKFMDITNYPDQILRVKSVAQLRVPPPLQVPASG
jgi:hypothetical protein